MQTQGGRAHLHGKGLAAASMLAHEGALLLVEGRMWLWVEGGGVGAAAALPWTPAHVPLGRTSSCAAPEVTCA